MFVRGNSRFKFGYFLSSASTLLAIGVTLIIVGCWIFFYKWESRPEIRDEGYMIISSQFRKFSYDELQNATRCFMEELGSGASGTVYKGILEQEFRSELCHWKNLSDESGENLGVLCRADSQALGFRVC